MKPTVLIAEDEEHLLSTLVLNFELEGYTVYAASNGIEAIRLFKEVKPNLLVLDIMMPGISGLEVCRKIREQDTSTPILFLTARGSGSERIEGLKVGADDYLTKPFNLEELLLRSENLLKRSLQRKELDVTPPKFLFGNFEINFSTYEVVGLEGRVITLGKKEILLLKLLTEKKGQVVSREEIMEKVWGGDVTYTSRTIDNFILLFRKCFERDTKNPVHFHTIRGIGYKFTEK